MKNHNVYDFSGDLETSLKNGEFKYIIHFPGTCNGVLKILEKFNDRKEIEEDGYKRTLIKFRSPFRIGIQRINILQFENLYNKDNRTLDENKLVEIIKLICKKYQNNLVLFPIQSYLLQFKDQIDDLLNKNVRNTKILTVTV